MRMTTLSINLLRKTLNFLKSAQPNACLVKVKPIAGRTPKRSLPAKEDEMNYEIVLQSEAVDDIQAVFDWYEAQRSGLGYEFIDEIEDGLERLSRHPQHYSATSQKYRKLR